MKFLKYNFVLPICLVLMVSFAMNAQEVIKEKATEAVKENPTKRQKVDGVIATVGDYIVLDSDIDKSFLEITAGGGSVSGVSRCQMLGKLLEDKLYAHQAIQDSIVVSDSDIKGMMEDRLNYMVENLGSMDKVVEMYKKSSEEELRSTFFDVLKEQKLSSEMGKKFTYVWS
jgi:peptidyl-prolyl cis-trans isomerase SurA